MLPLLKIIGPNQEENFNLGFKGMQLLYSFLVPGVKKADLKNFRELFLLHLKMNLMKEEFGAEDINNALEEYKEITVAQRRIEASSGP